MRIAIAPNAFRGSITAVEAVYAIREGLHRSNLADLDLIEMPLADGGDGTLDVLLRGLGGEPLATMVTGPNGVSVQAEMGLLADGQTAVIEMARASGVELVRPNERRALEATSYGTGELIKAALARGYRQFVIGIGGSASTDGGVGCMQALGVRLLDSHRQEIPRGGGGLAQLTHIEVESVQVLKAEGATFTVLCDVTNPLIGPQGAARVFAPQKGASPAQVEALERNLAHFADVVQRDLGVDVHTIAGGGAAGGFGAGAVAFLNAQIVPGAPYLIKLLGYDQQLADIDLLITGEGKIDAQTVDGKAVQRIAELAAKQHIPVIAFAGTLEADQAALSAMGIHAAWGIVPGPCSLSDALAHGSQWLARAAEKLGNTLAIKLH